jgi:hypothetical protein
MSKNDRLQNPLPQNLKLKLCALKWTLWTHLTFYLNILPQFAAAHIIIYSALGKFFLTRRGNLFLLVFN